VKGGKEANVYACEAHPASGLDWIAAKLYRERMLRNLKNDAVYKIGRTIRDREGKQVRNSRERRAIINKSGYGQKVDFMMWVGTEYRTQTMLYEAGADVPKPVAQHGHTILMEFIGDAYGAAPALNETSLDHDEAAPLFQRVMDNVKIMLDHHLIHGDLSAYNILYWEGDIWLIDFPQAVEARTNPHAFDILQRDITRVCEYFARFDVVSDPQQLTWNLWQPYSQKEGIE
jgi:RIO kinase 1